MDSKTYLQESKRTASVQFHDEIITPDLLAFTLNKGIAAGQLVDVAKKSLFYGKSLGNNASLVNFCTNESNINHKAVDADVLHAALGIFTEATELLEAILAAMNGEELDHVNLFEELGDVEWYMAMLYRYLEKTPEEAKKINIDKLRKRFPEKFTTEDAINRDTDAERAILESSG